MTLRTVGGFAGLLLPSQPAAAGVTPAPLPQINQSSNLEPNGAFPCQDLPWLHFAVLVVFRPTYVGRGFKARPETVAVLCM